MTKTALERTTINKDIRAIPKFPRVMAFLRAVPHVVRHAAEIALKIRTAQEFCLVSSGMRKTPAADSWSLIGNSERSSNKTEIEFFGR